MPEAVAVSQLVKRYRGAAGNSIDDISATLEEGQSVGLLGPNGAGKTTLVKLLCGVTRPTSGTVRVFGGDPFTDASGTKRSLAVVHQSSPMDMMLSVRDNIKIAVAFRGLTWRQARGRVTELVDEFNLGSCMDKVAFTLSGGQQRRVQIVRSLVVAPRLFLLDEPSIGLDPTGRRRLWDHLGRLRAEHGVTLVLTSHNMDEIEQNCSQVIVLKEGRIIRNAPHGDITAEFGGTSAVVTFAEEVGPDELREIAGTHGVALKSLDRIRIEVIGDDLEGFVSTLLKYWAGRAGAIRSIAFSCVSLEEAFIRLTERA